MKYAITGHSSNIGKTIYDKLTTQGIDCCGFSRSNGYDISDPTARARIIAESADCDVFINNARSKFSQSELLLEYFLAYRTLPKVIVNVGSVIAEDTMELPIKWSDDYFYINMMYKVALKNLCKRLNDQCALESNQDIAKIRIEYVWFGWVDTDFIRENYPHRLHTAISLGEAADKILGCV